MTAGKRLWFFFAMTLLAGLMAGAALMQVYFQTQLKGLMRGANERYYEYFLRRLNADRGMTIVVATHDLNFAAGLCRDLLLLREGRVLASGPTTKALTRESVRALYDVEADVTFHQGAGHLTVVPLRRVRGTG